MAASHFNPDFSGSETVLALTSALNWSMPFWIRRCRGSSSFVFLACHHFFHWLTQVPLGEDPGQCRPDSGQKGHEWCHWGALSVIVIALFLLIKLNLNWCRRTCLSPCTRQWRASCARYSHGLIVANHSSAPCENHDLVSQPFMESVSDCEWQCHRTQFSMQCHFHWGMDATGKVSVLMKGFLLETDDSMEMCQWGAGVVFQVNCLQISACNDSLS